MKEIILIILLFTSNICAAGYVPSEEVKIKENWIRVAGNSNYYLNPYTVLKNGEKRKLWIMDDQQENGSNKFQVEFDCKRERMKLIYMVNYSGSGDILSSLNVSDVENLNP